MATKTTGKTTARKSAPARKSSAAVSHKPSAPKRKQTRASGKVAAAPAAPPKPVRAAVPAPKAPPKVTKPAEDETPALPKPEPKARAESVSLIDKAKPRPKRAEGDENTRRSVLPPISRIRATQDVIPGPAPEAPPKKAEPIVQAPTPDGQAPDGAAEAAEAEVDDKKIIHIKPPIIVKELASHLGLKNHQLIKELMLNFNIFANADQTIEPDVATKICENHGFVFEMERREKGAGVHKVEQVVVAPPPPVIAKEEELKTRGPIITFMGHVDHGKTSLMDAIRKTRVAAGEAGGITQHIGAYSVDYKGNKITFLDTPGHAAFTAMRARGANVTDIVVLVVAADDGLMPQTIEAINHAKAASVPIIVAINKIDKPGANSDRVKNALSEHGLISESWGGDTIMVEVSAKEKTGLDTLLEMILLQSEVLELKADPQRLAKGVVVEAKLERGRGPIATVLVQSGTLRVGDVFVVGIFSGKVRALITHTGAKVQEAGPSIPVEVAGLPGVPSAGDVFQVVKDERVAREIAEDRARKQRTADLSGSAKVTLDDLFAKIKEGSVKELALVIKSDVQGSAEALTASVEKLATAAVKLRVIHGGVGGITESDVLLAAASNAMSIGFNVRPEPKAAALAEQQGVDVRLYTIIYDAMTEIKAAMEGLLEPTLKERILGRAEVRQVFTVSKAGVIAGAYVVDGTITRAAVGVRVLRDNVVVYEGKLGSLRRFKDDVREVQQGYECGISVENFNDIKAGDIIEAYAVDKIAAKL